MVVGTERRPVIGEAEYARLEEGFRRAWAECPDSRQISHFLLVGQPVRVRVAGRRLANDLLRAFSHLRVEGPARDTALAIDLWDEGETGVAVDGLAPGGDPNAPGATRFSRDRRLVVTAHPQTRTVLDRTRRRIVGWVGESARLTLHEIGRPLLSELMFWHTDRGVQAIHAGLVARGDGGVLLGGPGGSGKSTTALACLEAGYRYLADDYVGVSWTPETGFVGHSLYCSAHLDPEHLRRFPDLEPHALPPRLPREDKCLLMLSDARADRLGQAARIRAVALPRLATAGPPRLRAASRVEGMLRLAHSSLSLLPYPGFAAPAFHQLAQLVERVPAYWLELGSDVDVIPQQVGAILDQVD